MLIYSYAIVWECSTTDLTQIYNTTTQWNTLTVCVQLLTIIMSTFCAYCGLLQQQQGVSPVFS